MCTGVGYRPQGKRIRVTRDFLLGLLSSSPAILEFCLLSVPYRSRGAVLPCNVPSHPHLPKPLAFFKVGLKCHFSNPGLPASSGGQGLGQHKGLEAILRHQEARGGFQARKDCDPRAGCEVLLLTVWLPGRKARTVSRRAYLVQSFTLPPLRLLAPPRPPTPRESLEASIFGSRGQICHQGSWGFTRMEQAFSPLWPVGLTAECEEAVVSDKC